MRRAGIRIVVGAALGALLVGLIACSPPTATPSATSAASAAPSASSGPAIPVLGTENFYADLLAQIGGARVKASSLLNDPNVDPHSYEASPQAAALVADAKLVIVNGVGYDDFMQKLLDASPKADRVVIEAQKVGGFADDVNPHIWYDPKTMPKLAEAASAALAQLDPANASFYAAQKDKYVAALKGIDDKIAQLKAKYAGAPIAFTEDVAGYQTEAIGLDLKTPEGFMHAIEQGTDPAPADVAAERDLIAGKKVKVLVYNSQVTSPITQQIHDLAEKNGVPIVGVSETIPPSFHTFQEWQLGQLSDLEKALAQGR
jgi:zinc/manganese transport system substrate-binding protein